VGLHIGDKLKPLASLWVDSVIGKAGLLSQWHRLYLGDGLEVEAGEKAG